MALALRLYAEDPALCGRHAMQARRAVEQKFGIEAMVKAYMAVYDNMFANAAAYRVRSRFTYGTGNSRKFE